MIGFKLEVNLRCNICDVTQFICYFKKSYLENTFLHRQLSHSHNFLETIYVFLISQ